MMTLGKKHIILFLLPFIIFAILILVLLLLPDLKGKGKLARKMNVFKQRLRKYVNNAYAPGKF